MDLILLPSENTSVAATGIPSHLLEIIFLLSASDDRVKVEERAFTAIAVSQVCRYWRAVALEFPAIWGHIISFTEPLDWLSELINKPNPYPLDFGNRGDGVIDLSRRTDEDHGLGALRLMLKQADRFRRVHLSIKKGVMNVLRNDFLHRCSPLTEYLGLHQLERRPYFYSGPLFQNHAPKLRYLCLYGVIVSLEALKMLPHLEALVINVHYEPNFDLFEKSMDKWLDVLEVLTSLRYLGFTHLFFAERLLSQAQSRTIYMPNLQILRLDGKIPLECYFRFLESVELPKTCGLILAPNLDKLDVSNFRTRSRIMDVFKKRIDGWSPDT
jgi:hypothetical protein